MQKRGNWCKFWSYSHLSFSCLPSSHPLSPLPSHPPFPTLPLCNVIAVWPIHLFRPWSLWSATSGLTACGYLNSIESHKDHQLTFLAVILPPPFLIAPSFKMTALVYSLAYIPLLCLSSHIIPRQVQLLSHNRVCPRLLVSGQPFSSLLLFFSL